MLSSSKAKLWLETACNSKIIVNSTCPESWWAVDTNAAVYACSGRWKASKSQAKRILRSLLMLTSQTKAHLEYSSSTLAQKQQSWAKNTGHHSGKCSHACFQPPNSRFYPRRLLLQLSKIKSMHVRFSFLSVSSLISRQCGLYSTEFFGNSMAYNLRFTVTTPQSMPTPWSKQALLRYTGLAAIDRTCPRLAAGNAGCSNAFSWWHSGCKGACRRRTCAWGQLCGAQPRPQVRVIPLAIYGPFRV